MSQVRYSWSSLSLAVKAGIVVALLAAVGFVGLLVFRMFFVTFVDNYELGYIYNARTGKVVRMERTGYVVATPFINAVHTIDLRPGQVCMNANARVLNCKLVRFNPDGFDTVITWHGRGAGEGEGYATSSSGGGTSGGIYEILKSYAFNVNEGRDCPFLTILDDMRRKDAAGASAPAEVK